jgi:hypothetical protein
MVTGYEHDQHEFMKSMAISLNRIAKELIALNEKLTTLNGYLDESNDIAAKVGQRK